MLEPLFTKEENITAARHAVTYYQNHYTIKPNWYTLARLNDAQRTLNTLLATKWEVRRVTDHSLTITNPKQEQEG